MMSTHPCQRPLDGLLDSMGPRAEHRHEGFPTAHGQSCSGGNGPLKVDDLEHIPAAVAHVLDDDVDLARFRWDGGKPKGKRLFRQTSSGNMFSNGVGATTFRDAYVGIDNDGGRFDGFGIQ